MNQLIIRRYPEFSSKNIKRTKCTYPTNEYLSIDPKKLHDVSYPLPQIAIKKAGDDDSRIFDELQIALINGSWDTSDDIPSIVAEMQNTCSSYQYDTSIQHIEKNSDVDSADMNLSWLLDFKFHDLPPIPGLPH